MHTRCTLSNPYSLSRYAYAWEHVPANTAAHLDFGCSDGPFLRALDNKRIGQRIGIDAARDAIGRARSANPDITFIHKTDVVPIPFQPATFNSITVLDVLEHIAPQRELLVELNRVLRADGVLIVTVPGRHMFTILDMGNLKFRFPRLHRWWYTWRHSAVEYERRYSANPDGLIGDISADKRWHEHFSRRQLRVLLASAGFDVVDFDGTGLFQRIITPFAYVLGRVRIVRRVLSALMRLDSRCFESTNLFCTARKRLSGKRSS